MSVRRSSTGLPSTVARHPGCQTSLTNQIAAVGACGPCRQAAGASGAHRYTVCRVSCRKRWGLARGQHHRRAVEIDALDLLNRYPIIHRFDNAFGPEDSREAIAVAIHEDIPSSESGAERECRLIGEPGQQLVAVFGEREPIGGNDVLDVQGVEHVRSCQAREVGPDPRDGRPIFRRTFHEADIGLVMAEVPRIEARDQLQAHRPGPAAVDHRPLYRSNPKEAGVVGKESRVGGFGEHFPARQHGHEAPRIECALGGNGEQ